eukprot:gene6918-8044_t
MYSQGYDILFPVILTLDLMIPLSMLYASSPVKNTSILQKMAIFSPLVYMVFDLMENYTIYTILAYQLVNGVFHPDIDKLFPVASKFTVFKYLFFVGKYGYNKLAGKPPKKSV